MDDINGANFSKRSIIAINLGSIRSWVMLPFWGEGVLDGACLGVGLFVLGGGGVALGAWGFTAGGAGLVMLAYEGLGYLVHPR